MQKYAVISTDFGHLYSFFMPITAMLWKNHIGFDTISILIGNQDIWNKRKEGKLIYEETMKYSSKIKFLPVVPKMKSASTAQVSRIFASAHTEINDDDYLLSADVDMFPLHKKWFNEQDDSKRLHIRNAQHWKNVKRFAICYVGGKAITWREIMNIRQDGIFNEMKRVIKTKDVDWRYDERTLTKNILSWDGWKKDVQLINKAPYSGIYRANGNFDGNKRTIVNNVEAHVWRPGYMGANWINVMRLLKTVCTPEEVSAVKIYRREYCKSRGLNV